MMHTCCVLAAGLQHLLPGAIFVVLGHCSGWLFMDVVADNAKWCSQTARLSHLLQAPASLCSKRSQAEFVWLLLQCCEMHNFCPVQEDWLCIQLLLLLLLLFLLAKASCNQMDHAQHIAYDYKLLCCTAGMFSSASVSDSQACSVAKLAVMRATGQSVKAKLSITYVTCMQVSLVAGHAQSFLFPKGVTKAMFDLQIVYLIDNSWFLTTA